MRIKTSISVTFLFASICLILLSFRSYKSVKGLVIEIGDTNDRYELSYSGEQSEWQNSKYSMFIHWGLYSQLGGVWNGEPVTKGYSEQIQSFAGIFSDYYQKTMDEFRAEKWNADSIVEIAKKAGMRSIVFTAKHHDGFCMYDTKISDYKITNTPFGRDVLKEISASCKKSGIGFGIYFSLIDWNFPQAYPISSHNADPITPEHHNYNMSQVKELLTDYGPVSEFWFDMGSLTERQSEELYKLVKQLQPKCMVSSRLGNGYGDFAVMPDNKIPHYYMGQPWQTAASMFKETWGYRSWQQRGDIDKKTNEKLYDLLSVTSNGGNYLLNIGPRGDGSVVDFEKDVLIKMGEWLSNHQGILTDTIASKRELADNPVFQRERSLRKPDISLKSYKTDSSYSHFKIGAGKGLKLIISYKGEILYKGILNETAFKINGKNYKLYISDNKIYIAKSNENEDSIILSKENGNPVYRYFSKNYYDSYMRVCGMRWNL